jgi:hypothetical protein
MKVKELIEKLSKCDPELDAAYEHCYIDYVQEKPNGEDIVEMGGLRPAGYSRWIPLEKIKPDVGDFPCLFAIKMGNKWEYHTNDTLPMCISTAAECGGLWMPIERTKDHLEQILKGK